MTLDQLFCSIESAKRLRELGFEKTPLFYLSEHMGIIPLAACAYVSDQSNYYPAYTAAELLEMLPADIFIEDREYGLTINKTELNKYVLYYDYYRSSFIYISFRNKNLSEACALCLIHLLENKLIDVREVNK